MKFTINPAHIVRYSLFFLVFLAGSGFAQIAGQRPLNPQNFTLVYSSNVSGEYEPCG